MDAELLPQDFDFHLHPGFEILITRNARHQVSTVEAVEFIEQKVRRWLLEPESKHRLGFCSISLVGMKDCPVAIYLDYRRRMLIILSNAYPFPLIGPEEAEALLPFCVPYIRF